MIYAESVVTAKQVDGSWANATSKLNHYGDDSDEARWIVEGTTLGSLTRSVSGPDADLAATTSATGDVRLQLVNLHGDVAATIDPDLDGNWSWRKAIGSVAKVASYASMIPGPIGTIAGVVSAVAYVATGNWKEAAWAVGGALAATIGAGAAVKGAKMAITAVKASSKVAKLGASAGKASRAAVRGGRAIAGAAGRGGRAIASVAGRAGHGVASGARTAAKVGKPAWQNMLNAIDHGRAYQSRGSFVGLVAGGGYCVYKQDWSNCGKHMLTGAGIGNLSGGTYGAGKIAARGLRNLRRRR